MKEWVLQAMSDPHPYRLGRSLLYQLFLGKGQRANRDAWKMSGGHGVMVPLRSQRSFEAWSLFIKCFTILVSKLLWKWMYLSVIAGQWGHHLLAGLGLTVIPECYYDWNMNQDLWAVVLLQQPQWLRLKDWAYWKGIFFSFWNHAGILLAHTTFRHS